MLVSLQPRLHVQTTLQRVILQNDVESAKINKSKQRTAFPPNFVHSIDSTHMLMTAAACMKAGPSSPHLLDTLPQLAHSKGSKA